MVPMFKERHAPTNRMRREQRLAMGDDDRQLSGARSKDSEPDRQRAYAELPNSDPRAARSTRRWSACSQDQQQAAALGQVRVVGRLARAIYRGAGGLRTSAHE